MRVRSLGGQPSMIGASCAIGVLYRATSRSCNRALPTAGIATLTKFHRPSFRLTLAGLLAALMLASLAPVASATTGPIGVFTLLGNLTNAKGTSLAMAMVGTPHF